jgi:hypothetical protein
MKQMSLASSSIARGGRDIDHVVNRVTCQFASAPLLPVPQPAATLPHSEAEFDQATYGLRQRRLLGLVLRPLDDRRSQWRRWPETHKRIETDTSLRFGVHLHAGWLDSGVPATSLATWRSVKEQQEFSASVPQYLFISSRPTGSEVKPLGGGPDLTVCHSARRTQGYWIGALGLPTEGAGSFGSRASPGAPRFRQKRNQVLSGIAHPADRFCAPASRLRCAPVACLADKAVGGNLRGPTSLKVTQPKLEDAAMKPAVADCFDKLAEARGTNADYCRRMAEIVRNRSSKENWVRLVSWTKLAADAKARSRWPLFASQ